MSDSDQNQTETTTTFEPEWSLTHEDLSENQFIAILPSYRPWTADNVHGGREVDLMNIFVDPEDIPEVQRLAVGGRSELVELLVRWKGLDEDEAGEFVDRHLFGPVVLMPILVAQWMSERMPNALWSDAVRARVERKKVSHT